MKLLPPGFELAQTSSHYLPEKKKIPILLSVPDENLHVSISSHEDVNYKSRNHNT